MKNAIILTALLIPATALAGPFDGPYAGAYAGHGWAEDKGVARSQITGAANGWTHQPKPEGFLLGAMAGYNWRLDSGLVLGLEADIDGRIDNDDRTNQKRNGVSSPDFDARTKIKASASLRGRLGYLVGKQTLAYATAGYAAASVTRTWRDLEVAPVKESHSTVQGGWTAGLGLDHALSDRLSARVEYRHTDYGSKKVAANLWNELNKQELREDAVRIGLTYRF